MTLNGKRILVVEDDHHVYELIKASLKSHNVELTLASDGKTGLEQALKGTQDLIILDIMLPEKSGWEVCRQLKEGAVKTPIIMLTAKAEEVDKVLGLELGADDYITKPFSPREFVARIKAVLRRFDRSLTDENSILNYPLLTIDGKRYQIRVGEKTIEPPPKEFELLFYLASNPGQVFSREQLLEQIWGYSSEVQTRTIDEHIKRLRQRLDDAGLDSKEDLLKTIWGVGYKFEAEGE